MVGESLGKKFDREGEESDEEKHYYKRDKSRKRRGKRYRNYRVHGNHRVRPLRGAKERKRS